MDIPMSVLLYSTEAVSYTHLISFLALENIQKEPVIPSPILHFEKSIFHTFLLYLNQESFRYLYFLSHIFCKNESICLCFLLCGKTFHGPFQNIGNSHKTGTNLGCKTDTLCLTAGQCSCLLYTSYLLLHQEHICNLPVSYVHQKLK